MGGECGVRDLYHDLSGSLGQEKSRQSYIPKVDFFENGFCRNIENAKR